MHLHLVLPVSSRKVKRARLVFNISAVGRLLKTISLEHFTVTSFLEVGIYISCRCLGDPAAQFDVCFASAQTENSPLGLE